MGKKYLIQTFGCQMNVHDSEQMGLLLEGAGYEATYLAQEADLIILNTCSIREKAAQKVYSQLGRLDAVKRENPDLIIGIGGCLAQQLGNQFFKKAPCLDLVFGTQNIQRLPELLKTVEKNHIKVADTAVAKDGCIDNIPVMPKKGQVSAFVTIMRGCNNFCSYCVVPYLRGPEESRELEDIIQEVEMLANQGVKEITLLGQNVNSYGNNRYRRVHFHDLIRSIADIAGIERIRFTTSHPKDLSLELMRCFADVDKMCKHIHLPVQSGSDKILQAMNRGYGKEDYLRKVNALRAICPEIGLTSDIIVGFPGEGEADFDETIDLMEKVRFDALFSFKYSERAGTAAEKLEHKVTESIKSRRLRRLQSLQELYTLENNRKMLGKEVEVLVEGRSRNAADEVMGRTRTNKIVNFKGGLDLVGKMESVMIIEAYQHSLRAERLLDKEPCQCL